MEEEWKKVEKFRKLEVSNLGNVRTVWEHKTKVLKPMEMKTTVGNYLKVSVTDVETGKQKQIGIHNLVAEAFVQKPENPQNLHLEPNHNDGDKHNNISTNLEWMTRRQNLQHAINTGLRVLVDDQGKSLYIDKSKPVKVLNTLTQEEILCSSAKEASELTDIPARTVQYNAFKRKEKQPVKGFIFNPE